MKYFSGWDVEIKLPESDANGDDTIDERDLLRLMQYFSGWNVILGPVR